MFVAGVRTGIVCELKICGETSPCAGTFCKKVEKKLADARVGARNEKKAPPVTSATNKAFFAFPGRNGSTVGVGSIW